ncbi:uncharacterized protein LOC131041628 isoform X1 [Cryptomeria japonica]|uniref:uncharacterized protein LOC131041628 isoform X1 n=1 Tax=Cryptomeria japonica TaxID=3369 RepID=UPI0027D9F77B|nr:uncharacterized protein LOC131041628 isoform X1 [Cryptomeria japonica]
MCQSSKFCSLCFCDCQMFCSFSPFNFFLLRCLFYLVVWWCTACTLVFLSIFIFRCLFCLVVFSVFSIFLFVLVLIFVAERRKRQNRGRGRGRATKGNFFFQVQMEACEASGEGRFPDIGCWMWSNEGIRNRWIIENWMPIFIISKFRGTKS